MKTKTITTYSINELSEDAQKEAYYNWLSNFDYPWGDDNRESLNSFCDFFGVTCRDWFYDAHTSDYSFEIHNENTENLKGKRLYSFLVNSGLDTITPKYGDKKAVKLWDTDGCPFTGFYMDDVLIEPIIEFLKKPYDITYKDLIDKCLNDFFKACVDDYFHSQSMQAFIEQADCNEWEFLEDGRTA